MRSLSVEFKSSEKEEKGEAFKVTLERQTPAGWVGSADAVSYFKNGDRQTLLLEDTERLVIEPHGATVEMVYDKEQNATMPRYAYETQPDAAQKQEMEKKRQQEAHEAQFGPRPKPRPVVPPKPSGMGVPGPSTGGSGGKEMKNG